MAVLRTPRLALPHPDLNEDANVPEDVRELALSLDDAAIVDQGALSARPVSSPAVPGIRGRFYWATDTSTLFYDAGTGWNPINPTLTVDGAANVGTLRTLGTGPAQATAGDDARLSDARVPTDLSVTPAKIAGALRPSSGAGNSTEALRAIGAGAGEVVAGTDPRMPAYVFALPSSPVDGQEIYFIADSPNGVAWHLRYRTAHPAPYRWEFLGGSPLTSFEGASTGNLGTGAYGVYGTGPQVQVPIKGFYLVEAHCQWTASANARTYMGVGVTGAAGAIEHSIDGLGPGAYGEGTLALKVVVSATYAVPNQIIMKFQQIGGVGTAAGRFICAYPIRVG
jgi:hypothetical protein